MIQNKKVCHFFINTGLCMFMILICLMFGRQTVWANGEKLYFGSETYEWETGEENPIGIHTSADTTLESFHYTVTYDPEVLEYVRGGTRLSDNEIEVRVNDVNDTHYVLYLYFKPLTAGDTEIEVQDITITGRNGSEKNVDDISAPVHVPMSSGSMLSDIKINGESIPGFQSDKLEYMIYVSPDDDNAVIETFPSDVTTDISDTALKEGNNNIAITCTDADGKSVIYSLHVFRPSSQEMVEVTDESVAEEQDQTFLESFGLSGSSGALFFLMMILLILIIVFFLLLVEKIRLVRKRKRWERRREERRREEQRRREWQLLEEDDTEAAETDKQEEIPKEQQPDVQEDIPESVESPEDNREIEISVRNVTMDFKREKDESSSIKETLIKILKRQREVISFRALENISFDVHKGEVVGIIGTNGSGKSTILKIISGALIPSAGEVNVDRRKIQLLTLGTGFDMELTGRENIYLNGAIIGYTKEYIDEKYDDIVKFAELEGFMEERVKNYSSGMVSRLGFAIATCRETPEILILDEVLSVGDMFFRKKSEARIQEMIHGGSTVLIVSHSTSVIKKNCTKVVWIERGHLRAVGDPEEVCNAYEAMNS